MKWLKFGCKFPSKWLSFQSQSTEYFYLARPNGIEELEAGVHDYVRYYNHERIKLRLKGLSPVQYRLRNTA
jgi:transposase InsO family protein